MNYQRDIKKKLFSGCFLMYVKIKTSVNKQIKESIQENTKRARISYLSIFNYRHLLAIRSVHHCSVSVPCESLDERSCQDAR
jgi:hypothetical protein